VVLRLRAQLLEYFPAAVAAFEDPDALELLGKAPDRAHAATPPPRPAGTTPAPAPSPASGKKRIVAARGLIGPTRPGRLVACGSGVEGTTGRGEDRAGWLTTNDSRAAGSVKTKKGGHAGTDGKHGTVRHALGMAFPGKAVVQCLHAGQSRSVILPGHSRRAHRRLMRGVCPRCRCPATAPSASSN
jgi:hypothetical protein